MNVGTGKAIIIGIGEYTGQVIKNFEIIKKDIDYTTINDIEEQEYEEKEIKPEIIISNDGVLLEDNKDYTFEYNNNEEQGTATIIIKGNGNYTGTAIKTFNIVDSENEKTNNEQEKIDKDKTIADKILPNTGKKIAIYLLIIVTIFGTIFYIKFKRFKKLKI